jgi:hypothetical protein
MKTDFADVHFVGLVLFTPVIIEPQPTSLNEAIEQHNVNIILNWNALEQVKLFAAIHGHANRYVYYTLFSERHFVNNITFNQLCRAGNGDLIPYFLKSSTNEKSMLRDGLLQACLGGHLKLVSVLQNYGATAEPSTLLSYSQHHIHLFKHFVEEFNTDITDSEYYESACQSGDLEYINFCIEKGCTTSWQAGVTGAIKGGHTELAKKILQDNRVSLSHKELDEHLHSTCERSRYNTALWLLEHEFPIVHEKTLSAVCKNGWKDIAHLIMNKGCTKAQLAYGLRGASYGGHKDLIELLAEQIEKVNYPVEWNWAMYAICSRGHIELIDFIMSKENNPQWPPVNSGLIAAAEVDYRDLVDLLVSKGAVLSKSLIMRVRSVNTWIADYIENKYQIS